MLYDVFICHASEDKDSFVRPLAEALKNSHLEVWYDEFSLVVGDSLENRSIRAYQNQDMGLLFLAHLFLVKNGP